MENNILQLSIGELLDGRYFYIPAYQRGYRWTEKQVGDMLRDFLCFANENKKENDFYCLQPVITRRMNDDNKLKSIFGNDNFEDVRTHGAWEIIDGQQRLTTIFLIYKYLVDQKGWDANTLQEEEDGKTFYHLYYATRKDSTAFLETLSLNTTEQSTEINSNVDFYHMAHAFNYIDNWIKTDGKDINQRYKLGGSLGKIRDSLFALLNGTKETKDGSVQVLWYELANDGAQNGIKEFQKINTGNIKLTDAELIKGLFLLNKNFESGSKFIKQSELAIEWEFIENTLHSNNFWYFLQKKGSDLPNRIDLLFSLIYKMEKIKDKDEKEWDNELKQAEELIQDIRKGEIFRFYYNRFEGKMGEDLQQEVSKAWAEVMELFRTIDDWFCTPGLYNMIGLLSQCGEDISRLVLHYKYMPDDSIRDDFMNYLKDRIRYYLRDIKVNDEGDLIMNSYPKDRDSIYKLLLTLNIRLLNEQNNKFESESDVYKFPFDVLNAQDWDIEHIDSFHTNALKKDTQKMEWIDTAIADRANELSDEDKMFIEEKKQDGRYDEAIHFLKKNAEEVEIDDDLKNSIGNLTLLDASTNRKYGNSLFCTKRRIIIERMEHGVFVPIATQYIFAKFFDKKGTTRSVWRKEDMIAYQKFIISKLTTYLVKKQQL